MIKRWETNREWGRGNGGGGKMKFSFFLHTKTHPKDTDPVQSLTHTVVAFFLPSDSYSMLIFVKPVESYHKSLYQPVCYFCPRCQWQLIPINKNLSPYFFCWVYFLSLNKCGTRPKYTSRPQHTMSQKLNLSLTGAFNEWLWKQTNCSQGLLCIRKFCIFIKTKRSNILKCTIKAVPVWFLLLRP